MKISRRMEWPEPRDLTTLEELSQYSLLLYQTLTEESALRAVELDVAFTDGYNVFLGHEAGASDTISLDDTEGIYNVFIGHQAGYSNTTGYKNMALGYQALYSNTTGAFNIAIGYESLKANVGGNLNMALGWQALLNATAVSGAIAIGYAAMGLGIVTGADNIAIGQATLYDMTSGFGNIGVGRDAISNVTTGDQNIAMGQASLLALITGNQNISIGYEAGTSCLGSGNIFIGHQAGLNETGSNTLYIANSNTATPLIGGVFPNTSLTFTSANSYFTGNVGIGTAAPNYSLEIATAGAAFQLYNTTHGANANFYMVAENDAGAVKYFVIGVDPDDATNGQLNIIPNSATHGNAVVSIESGGDVTVSGCISDSTCEIMKNEDALAIIDDILKTGSGKKDEHNHERMDMEKIHQKYPYMIHEQIGKDKEGKEEIKYFDKLGAKSDLIYVALGQLVERIEALEAQ